MGGMGVGGAKKKKLSRDLQKKSSRDIKNSHVTRVKRVSGHGIQQETLFWIT